MRTGWKQAAARQGDARTGRPRSAHAAESFLGVLADGRAVRIAGRTAKVKRFDEEGVRVYIATATNRPGLRAGRAYPVTVRAAGRTILDRRLVLRDR